MLPRSLLQIQRFRFSFHAMVGGRRAEAFLFLAAGACAVALLIGLRPRLAAMGSWLFLASLDSRNPLLLNHGDELLRIFLFWSIFLPLASRGRPAAGEAGKRHLSIFTAALTLQVCMVYFFGALLKTDPSWGTTGTAIFSALGLEQLSTGLGRSLLEWPRLLRMATLGVYYLELLGPLMLFVPWKNRRIREVAILLFIAVHLGIAATLKLGLFPWVSILGWVLLLPSETLDRIPPGLEPDADDPEPSALNAPRQNAFLRLAVQILGLYLLAAVLVWNIRGLGIETEDVIPRPYDGVLRLAQLDQRWNMFAPKPNYIRGWYVAQADLADGSQVDLMNGGLPFSLKRPDLMAATYPDFRWRKYLINLWRARFERYRPGLAAFLRNRWDPAHPEILHIRRLTVLFVWQDLSAGSDPPIRTTVIATD